MLYIIKDWIMRGDEKLMWLPPEYPAGATECWNGKIAIVQKPGHVTWFENCIM
jgi:hypothetical protein